MIQRRNFLKLFPAVLALPVLIKQKERKTGILQDTSVSFNGTTIARLHNGRYFHSDYDREIREYWSNLMYSAFQKQCQNLN